MLGFQRAKFTFGGNETPVVRLVVIYGTNCVMVFLEINGTRISRIGRGRGGRDVKGFAGMPL